MVKYQFDASGEIKSGFTKRKKTIFITIIIISLLAINGITAYYHLATLNEEITHIIPSNMQYPINIGDEFIFKVHNAQNYSVYDNLTRQEPIPMIDNYSNYWNYTSYSYRRINDIYYYSVSEDINAMEINITSIESLNNISYYNINITEIVDEYTIKTDLNDNVILHPSIDVLKYSLLNITNGNLADTQLDIIAINTYSYDSINYYLEFQINSTGFSGFITNNVQVGDKIEILPHSAYDYAKNFPDLYLNFKPEGEYDHGSNNTYYNVIGLLVYGSLMGIPQDLDISDIFYDTDAIAEMLTLSDSIDGYDSIYANHYDIYDNTTIIEYPSDNSANYYFESFFSGINIEKDVQIDSYFNLTWKIHTYNKITDYLFWDWNYTMYMYNMTDPTLFYSKNSTSHTELQLIYTSLFEYPPLEPINDQVDLDYPSLILINENATINCTLYDSQVTALLYDYNDNLINIFTIENNIFNTTYSEAGIYTFKLDIYHNAEFNETISFYIEFYEITPELPQEQTEWYYYLIYSVSNGLGIFGIIYIIRKK